MPRSISTDIAARFYFACPAARCLFRVPFGHVADDGLDDVAAGAGDVALGRGRAEYARGLRLHARRVVGGVAAAALRGVAEVLNRDGELQAEVGRERARAQLLLAAREVVAEGHPAFDVLEPAHPKCVAARELDCRLEGGVEHGDGRHLPSLVATHAGADGVVNGPV